MPDHLTPEQRSLAMQRVKLKDGSLEMLVQRELRASGLKFRITSAPCQADRTSFSPSKRSQCSWTVISGTAGDCPHGNTNSPHSGATNFTPTAHGTSATFANSAHSAGRLSAFGSMTSCATSLHVLSASTPRLANDDSCAPEEQSLTGARLTVASENSHSKPLTVRGRGGKKWGCGAKNGDYPQHRSCPIHCPALRFFPGRRATPWMKRGVSRCQNPGG